MTDNRILQVVIPMAGLGTRFSSYGFKKNKYLLPIDTNLTPMIEAAICSLDINVPCKFFFIINEEHGVDSNLRDILRDISYRHDFEYVIASVNKLTEGPACTVSHIEEFIDMTCPMLISNSDQVLSWSFDRFYSICQNPKYDGCLLTYKPDYEVIIGEKDKHSFLRLDENKNVVECAEKIVLSDKALVGTHYISVASDYFDAYHYMIKHNMRAPNGEFYISLVYQAMIEQGKKISYYHLKPNHNEKFYPVGEPQDYFNYLYNPKCGGYENELIEFNPSIFSQRFSWYGKNGEPFTISINKYHFNEEYLFKIPTFFILLEGEAEAWNSVTDSWVKLEKYDIAKSKRILVKNGTKGAFIDHENKDSSIGIWHRDEFTRGWFIGNFHPSLYKTKDFEIGLLIHKAAESWDYHYHIEAEETNLLLKGRMKINEKTIEAGSVFRFPKKQIACPIFLEDCHIICIKEPSIPGDKYCL